MSKSKRREQLKFLATLVFALIVGMFCGYTARRSAAWTSLVLHRDVRLVVWVLFVGWCVACLALSGKYLVANSRTATWACGVSTFLFMYLSESVLISDLIRWIVRKIGPQTISQKTLFVGLGWVCIAFVLVMTLMGFFEARNIKTVSYRIPIAGLSCPCRLVLLSDLHIGYYVGRRHVQKTVERVNEANADMVVIAGDLINAGNTRECPEIDKVARLLANMKSKEGTFAVLGNHDPAVDDPELQQFLQASRIRLLEDEVYTNDCIQLIGRTTRTKPRKTMEQMLSDTDPDKPCVVADHDPLGIREAAGKAALVMCGHTHKGQVFPLNLFVRMLYSREECWGLGETQGTHTVVSAGTGYFSIPMRSGSHCEVTVVDLYPEKDRTETVQ